MKHVVIVGGGFAGVRLARKLRHQKDISVTLINTNPDFRYSPALYRAATGNKMGTARLPLEWMLLDSSNIDLVIGTVTGFNPAHKMIKLEDGSVYEYDFVVFAVGSITTYFNIEGLHEHSFGIKSADEVNILRAHLHNKISSRSEEEANYVIVGGGPTGVEVAGSFGGYLKRIAKKHHHHAHKVSIYLVEAAPRLLPQFPERASKLIAKRLAVQGVKVLVNTAVQRETINELRTSNSKIKTHTVIWTAGVATNPFYAAQGNTFEFGKGGKIVVNQHLEALPHVYVIGDNALTKYSGTALTAIWHANFVAKDIVRRMHGRKRPPQHERRSVHVVPAGHKWAIMEYGPIVLQGRIISLVRMAADYLGYSDVLGFLRSLTIWTNSERPEDDCETCHKN